MAKPMKRTDNSGKVDHSTKYPGVTWYETARSGRLFAAQWYDSSGSHRKKSGFKTARDADAFRNDQINARNHGRELDLDGARITISQLSEEWLAMREHVIKQRTWESEESHHLVHILP